MARPDAVFVHTSFKQGDELADRINSVLVVAEPILEIDKSKGESAHVRLSPYGEFLFVTRSPECTILYPINHKKKGTDRYKWIDQDGSTGKIRLGYLLDQPEVATV